MDCPSCKTGLLVDKTLEENLRAEQCSDCGGCWLSSEAYQRWLDGHGPTLPEKPYSEVSFDVVDSSLAKLCPACGRMLLKFKVGHGIDFHLDRCGGCNGVWLDRNEWEVLASRNLHDEVHSIFTTYWQQQVRGDELRASMTRRYQGRFGTEDYQEIRRIRAWLDGHPLRPALLAYLNDLDPYGL